MPEHISNIFVIDSSVVKLTSISDFSILSSLPPANEVWGKVIFSQACVKNSVHRGRGCLVWGRGVPGARGVPGPGGPGPGGCLVPGGGSWSWGVPGGDPPRTATAAGGTHPTGMHSCLRSDLKVL